MAKKVYVKPVYSAFHAFCKTCDFETWDNESGPRLARKHIREIGHTLSVEGRQDWELRDNTNYTTCQAAQQSDEMYCATCNLRWGINDPNPLKCNAR